MPERAAVSVIIPCFRCTRTIERAVTSVVNQTLRPAELILVDDASGDRTLELLHAFRDRYGSDWVHVISFEENRGPSSARNAGWDLATQPYVAFLDADDHWHPRKIDVQYRWMTAHPHVSLTGHRIVRADPLPFGVAAEGVKARRISGVELLQTNRFHTSSVMVPRDLPFRFEPGKRRSEDYLLWLTVVLAGGEAWRLHPRLAVCERHPEGLSGDLWEMEKAELDTFRTLRDRSYLSVLGLMWVTPISVLKYLRRVAANLGKNGA